MRGGFLGKCSGRKGGEVEVRQVKEEGEWEDLEEVECNKVGGLL
jgi:hypothetical protein